MALRDSGRLARNPNRSYTFCSGPKLYESSLWIEPRLDGFERERIGRKLVAKKPVLKNAGAAALHEFKCTSNIVAFQKKLDQRVINIALIGQEVCFQPRELQLRPQTFNP